MKPQTPAVAYYRMSSDKQETSIPDQRAKVTEYAAEHGYRIIREYVDEGISGDATEKRVQFQRMIRDAQERGDFKVILCWDQDRFGRFDSLEAGFWIQPLRKAGVRLETIAQGRIDWNDFAGRMVYGMAQEGKNAFLKDLSRNVIRGKLSSLKKGNWLYRAPMGYRLEAKRLVVDPLRADVVRWLFSSYAKRDTSMRQLAVELNERHVPTPSGKRPFWTTGVIRKMLRNPSYLGDTIWGRRREEGKYGHLEGGEIKATHEALVDEKTFKRVQEKLEENRKNTTPFVGGGSFLLSGLVLCGHCGRRMTGVDRKVNIGGKTYVYRKYCCSTYSTGGSSVCHYYAVDESKLIDCLVRKIREGVLNAESMQRLRDAIERQDSEQERGQSKDTAAAKAEIGRLTKQIEAGTERLLTLPDDLVPDAAAKLQEWRKRRDELHASMRRTRGTMTKPSDTEQALFHLERLSAVVNEGKPEDVRGVLKALVGRIELWFEAHRQGKKTTRYLLSRGLIHLQSLCPASGVADSIKAKCSRSPWRAA